LEGIRAFFSDMNVFRGKRIHFVMLGVMRFQMAKKSAATRLYNARLMPIQDLAVVIPAYRPGPEFKEFIISLVQTAIGSVVVINDGSPSDYDHLFFEIQFLPRVSYLRHESNLGKGVALKTGINYVACNFPAYDGVITADADGQHQVDDIIRVAERFDAESDCLVLGARQFDSSVPWRSNIGNRITRILFGWLVGRHLRDTQTGLRAIPRCLLPKILSIQSTGYEFELEMLIAAKHDGVRIVEEKIKTIYEPGNPSSHFNPLFDSLRIYFVLFRFTCVSLLTALLDNTVFLLTFYLTGTVLFAHASGRLAAVFFNYPAARKAVFLSGEKHSRLLPRYLSLVLISAMMSYALMQLLFSYGAQSVMLTKVISETLLFFLNFIVLRDFVFTRAQPVSKATNWDLYYRKSFWAAGLTRQYTASVLLALLRQIRAANSTEPFVVMEIGGANSCFLDSILTEIKPQEYHVVDLNEYGLEMLRNRIAGRTDVHLHREDVRALPINLKASLVFSIGLIEHFDLAGTRQAILSHFQAVRTGGYVVLSFPTPTWLYRIARWTAELAGRWQFPDERPLSRDEVLNVASSHGTVMYEKTLWPLVFTQRIMVIQARPSVPES
jgi:putative flippase GtrA